MCVDGSRAGFRVGLLATLLYRITAAVPRYSATRPQSVRRASCLFTLFFSRLYVCVYVVTLFTSGICCSAIRCDGVRVPVRMFSFFNLRFNLHIFTNTVDSSPNHSRCPSLGARRYLRPCCSYLVFPRRASCTHLLAVSTSEPDFSAPLRKDFALCSPSPSERVVFVVPGCFDAIALTGAGRDFVLHSHPPRVRPSKVAVHWPCWSWSGARRASPPLTMPSCPRI